MIRAANLASWSGRYWVACGAAGAVLVGVVAIGVEAVHDPRGQFGQLVGTVLGGLLSQVPFGLLQGLEVYPGW